ncbi:hypothetical protein HK101_011898 [Irineochytrium annulatum]|nr:hypothetical protein HK101_011898 [Irineochytrium annulatum]
MNARKRHLDAHDGPGGSERGQQPVLSSMSILGAGARDRSRSTDYPPNGSTFTTGPDSPSKRRKTSISAPAPHHTLPPRPNGQVALPVGPPSGLAGVDLPTGQNGNGTHGRANKNALRFRHALPTPETARLPAWTHGRRYNQRTPFARLHAEIHDFARYMTSTPEERRVRTDCFQRYRQLAHQARLGDLNLFGSSATGVFLPSSDLDCTLVDQRVNGKDAIVSALRSLKRVINRAGCTSEMMLIEKTKVPILKLTDRATRLKMDISVNQVDGVNNAAYIREKVVNDKSLIAIILVLKFLLYRNNLNEASTGGLGGFPTCLVVITFAGMYYQCHVGGAAGAVARVNAAGEPEIMGRLLTELFRVMGGMDFKRYKLVPRGDASGPAVNVGSGMQVQGFLAPRGPDSSQINIVVSG